MHPLSSYFGFGALCFLFKVVGSFQISVLLSGCSCLQKTAKSGLHILLGGICALTVVIFFRFIVLTRIKYGPARYWAILFVFWFLVFGIWASRTHDAHTT
ncbi:hypothetical protein NC653_013156 [Populus alba x Populus x berolinensis]|uniref:Uncharacterized protein n=1 Tax=Populus alba x Populus x berolinensis TaxID=444605 RepID=A0AAD6W263_9ROSI|nr:hypothetical protein NC653_013156 [Populus alba x Populus x berolinensis]